MSAALEPQMPQMRADERILAVFSRLAVLDPSERARTLENIIQRIAESSQELPIDAEEIADICEIQAKGVQRS